MNGLYESGTHFFLIDATSDVIAEVAKATAGKDILLFNVASFDDALRGKSCHGQLLHTIPSYAMLMDALGQYLIFKKWREILVLAGPRPQDQKMLAAFERSAKKFGLKIEDTREFILGNDPRRRGKNNVGLLTGKADYDVVFVADAVGDFGKEVPYQILDPRPVAGGAGLMADTWHWAWERYGAPQLVNRISERANRPMSGFDWSAWIAIKAITEALARAKTSEFSAMEKVLRSDDIIVDGFKGSRLNFRAWNGQLRQPIFLTTGEWVVERAPIEGFLHKINVLDSLGMDERESQCKL